MLLDAMNTSRLHKQKVLQSTFLLSAGNRTFQCPISFLSDCQFVLRYKAKSIWEAEEVGCNSSRFLANLHCLLPVGWPLQTKLSNSIYLKYTFN